MRKQELFFAACHYSGLIKLVRWWTQHSGRHLIILNYHRASEGDLRAHLLYLRRHYRLLHLEEALEELYALPDKRKQVRDRRTPLVLTFDDGYIDNYTHAYPLACELQVPITIFLIPGYVESGSYFWWLEGDRLIRHALTDKVTIGERTYHLNQEGERKELAVTIYQRARDATSVGAREAFLASIRKSLAVSSQGIDKEGCVVKWAEVHEMEKSGWVSFGGHTMHHPILGFLADPEEVKREVQDCRVALEQQLGYPVRTFAYPLGRFEHIGAQAPKAVREAGYDWAVTTIDGINTPQSDPLQLRRIECNVKHHWLVTAAKTSGVWQFFAPMLSFRIRLTVRAKKIVTRLLNL